MKNRCLVTPPPSPYCDIKYNGTEIVISRLFANIKS